MAKPKHKIKKANHGRRPANSRMRKARRQKSAPNWLAKLLFIAECRCYGKHVSGHNAVPVLGFRLITWDTSSEEPSRGR